jgi:hypothetical protein
LAQGTKARLSRQPAWNTDEEPPSGELTGLLKGEYLRGNRVRQDADGKERNRTSPFSEGWAFLSFRDKVQKFFSILYQKQKKHLKYNQGHAKNNLFHRSPVFRRDPK